MGKDTATFEQAKVHARPWLDPALIADPRWTEHESTDFLEWLEGTSGNAEPDAEPVSYLIKRAKTDKWVWDDLQTFVGDRLLHSRPIGKPLSRWAGAVLCHKRTRPKMPVGAAPTTYARNYLIIWALRMIRDKCGLTLTRNDASDPDSACDVVVAVLTEYEVNLSYKRVKEIWFEQPMGGYMPHVQLIDFLEWPGQRARPRLLWPARGTGPPRLMWRHLQGKRFSREGEDE